MPSYPGGKGRGILIPAGNEYLVGAYVIIGIARGLGCNLPVEIWHQGKAELNWIAELMARRFAGVTFRDIGRPGGAREKGGWQLKAEALARSAFEQVLLLDADNEPCINPDLLFEDSGFIRCGTVFWQDPRETLYPDHSCWQWLNLARQEHAALDSAQLLVDRKRAWPGVAIASYLNENSTTYWRDLYGDKDTFLLAWLKAGLPFSVIEPRPALSGGAILHWDRNGQLCFKHRADDKWSIKRPPGFEHPSILALLDELHSEQDRRAPTARR